MTAATSTLTNQIQTMMQRQYYQRPADERFANVKALADAAKADRELSRERTYNWRDLRWAPSDGGLLIASPNGTAALTHWSFGQSCSMLQSPAAFLRDKVTPEIAADVLNHRITQQPNGTAPVLLVRAANGNPLPQVRAVTTDSYARVWDHTLYSEIHQQLGERLSAPPTWDRGSDGKHLTGGAYRGDRDSTAVLISGGSIVNDPSARGGNGEMYRGLIVRNSEVGAAALHLITFLYRGICGNHLIWGVGDVKAFSRRHVGSNALRDTMKELYTLTRQLTTAGAAQEERIIKGLIEHEIASTREGVIDELMALGFTKDDATAAYERCEQAENASPRSYWGIAQGATRISQQTEYANERMELDQLAAKVLQKGRKLVAA